ncbi:MAG: hypothetical protein JWO59_251 [Chloroflexi bacterium]|nr:hypothetical protein [Chloroflexota bacterium]
MNVSKASATGTCATCGRERLDGAKFCTYCGTTFEAPPPRRSLRRFTPKPRRGGADLYYIVAAAVLAVVLSHLPLINIVIYPFTLFGTFVHEWCHALVAIATGGQVQLLQINSDFSGETITAGGWTLLIFSAGYVGAAIAGALLLLIPTRFAKRTLVGIGIASMLMPLIGGLSFGTSFTAQTWLWTVVFGGVTLFVGARAPQRIAGIFQQFVAIELCFTAIDSLRTLAWLSMNSSSTQTDATNAAKFIGMPALAWTIIWGVIAIAAIAFSVRRVVVRSFA